MKERSQNDHAIIVSGGTTIKGTFGYSILPVITPNTPNTYSRTATVYSSSATSNTIAFHSYKFTDAGNANIINISGYTGNSKLSLMFMRYHEPLVARLRLLRIPLPLQTLPL